MKFPLHTPPYPTRALDDDDAELLQRITDAGVTAMVHDYDYFMKCCQGDVSEDFRHAWKLVKRRENLAVYQDHAPDFTYGGTVIEAPTTSVLLCVGTITGTLDDLMYGVATHTADDTMLKSSCIGDNFVDCCVMASIISPAPHDPYRSLTLKWAVNAGPTMVRPFVQAREFTFIESTGITTNLDGERLGYHVIHSVDMPKNERLDHKCKLVQGNVLQYHIYRQKTPSTVEVHLRAFWELNGRMNPVIQSYSCVKATIAIHRLPAWSQMKKLTWVKQTNCDVDKQSEVKCCQLCKRWVGSWLTSAKSCSMCRSVTCWRCRVSKRMSVFSSDKQTQQKNGKDPCVHSTVYGFDGVEGVPRRKLQQFSGSIAISAHTPHHQAFGDSRQQYSDHIHSNRRRRRRYEHICIGTRSRAQGTMTVAPEDQISPVEKHQEQELVKVDLFPRALPNLRVFFFPFSFLSYWLRWKLRSQDAKDPQAQTLVQDVMFGEGPRFRLASKELYFSDMHRKQVLKYSLTSRKQELVYEDPEDMVSGLGWLPDGRMLIVSMNKRRVLVHDESKRSTDIHADVKDVTRFRANDMVVSASGRAYLGSFGFDMVNVAAFSSSAIVSVGTNGDVRVEATNMIFPNGMVITPDGKTLIAAETLAGLLTAFDIDKDGRLSNRRVWANIGSFADGICLDAEGCVWTSVVQSGVYPTGGGLLRVQEGGQIVDVLGFGANGIKNSVFACQLGTDAEGKHHLFFMEAGSSYDHVIFKNGVEAARKNGLVRSIEVSVGPAQIPGNDSYCGGYC